MGDPISQCDAGQPAGERQKHTFGEELPYQADPAGAHRKTNGNFPPPTPNSEPTATSVVPSLSTSARTWRARAQCHADADLFPPPHHRVRRDSAQAETRQQQRKNAASIPWSRCEWSEGSELLRSGNFR